MHPPAWTLAGREGRGGPHANLKPSTNLAGVEVPSSQNANRTLWFWEGEGEVCVCGGSEGRRRERGRKGGKSGGGGEEGQYKFFKGCLGVSSVSEGFLGVAGELSACFLKVVKGFSVCFLSVCRVFPTCTHGLYPSLSWVLTVFFGGVLVVSCIFLGWFVLGVMTVS